MPLEKRRDRYYSYKSVRIEGLPRKIYNGGGAAGAHTKLSNARSGGKSKKHARRLEYLNTVSETAIAFGAKSGPGYGCSRPRIYFYSTTTATAANGDRL